jgi:hypothetical protein
MVREMRNFEMTLHVNFDFGEVVRARVALKVAEVEMRRASALFWPYISNILST